MALTVPFTVTTLPLSLSSESPITPEAVNLASVPVVPLPVMPPPPAQLPRLCRQTVSLATFDAGMVIV